MGLHHAVLAASVIFRAVPLPGLYPCDLPILILCKSTPASSSLPPSLPSGRRCIECFWCPFVFYHHHPLPHERVPTFRFSINWLDYSSHSNQLARHTRLFALVIEIIIGPGEDIYICVYIYQWFGISELLCRYHVPLLPRDKFGIIAGSIYFHSCNLDCDLRIFNAFLIQFLFCRILCNRD